MAKKFIAVLLTLFLCVGLCSCGKASEAGKYVKIIKAYTEEKYGVGLESGQDTYVKIANDTEEGVEAYIYTESGLMFIIEEGASEAFASGESVSSYVTTQFPGKPGYDPPSAEELTSEWAKMRS